MLSLARFLRRWQAKCKGPVTPKYLKAQWRAFSIVPKRGVPAEVGIRSCLGDPRLLRNFSESSDLGPWPAQLRILNSIHVCVSRCMWIYWPAPPPQTTGNHLIGVHGWCLKIYFKIYIHSPGWVGVLFLVVFVGFGWIPVLEVGIGNHFGDARLLRKFSESRGLGPMARGRPMHKDVVQYTCTVSSLSRSQDSSFGIYF